MPRIPLLQMPRRIFPVALLRAACCRNPEGATPENTHMAAAWMSLQPKRPHVAARPCGAFHILGVAPVGPNNFGEWPPRGILHFGRGASGPFHILGVAPAGSTKFWVWPPRALQWLLRAVPHIGCSKFLEGPLGSTPKIWKGPRAMLKAMPMNMTMLKAMTSGWRRR